MLIIMNCFFLIILIIFFVKLNGSMGQVVQAARCLAMAWRPGCWRGGDFSHSIMSRQVLESTQPPIKCVLWAFPGVKVAKHRISHPISS